MDPLWLKVEAFAEKSLHLVALTRISGVQETGEATDDVIVFGGKYNLTCACVFCEDLLIKLEVSLSILKLLDQV
jgi:hypothetical protein